MGTTKMELLMREGDQISITITGIEKQSERRSGGGCNLYLKMGKLASSMDLRVETRKVTTVIIDGTEAIDPGEVRKVLRQTAEVAECITNDVKALDKKITEGVGQKEQGEDNDGDDKKGA